MTTNSNSNSSGARGAASFEVNAAAARADDFLLMMENVKRMRPPVNLMRSECPRLCVPLKSAHIERAHTFGDAIAELKAAGVDGAAGASLSQALARHRLAMCILMARGFGASAGKTGGTLEDPYTWLFAQADRRWTQAQRARAQRSALDACNKRSADIVDAKVRDFEPIRVFVDVNDRMWVFFVDGRYDFNKMFAHAARHFASERFRHGDDAQRTLHDCAAEFEQHPKRLLAACDMHMEGVEDLFSQTTLARSNDGGSAFNFTQHLMHNFEASAAFCEMALIDLRKSRSFTLLRLPASDLNVATFLHWPLPRALGAHFHQLSALFEKVTFRAHNVESARNVLQQEFDLDNLVLGARDENVATPLSPVRPSDSQDDDASFAHRDEERGGDAEREAAKEPPTVLSHGMPQRDNRYEEFHAKKNKNGGVEIICGVGMTDNERQRLYEEEKRRFFEQEQREAEEAAAAGAEPASGREHLPPGENFMDAEELDFDDKRADNMRRVRPEDGDANIDYEDMMGRGGPARDRGCGDRRGDGEEYDDFDPRSDEERRKNEESLKGLGGVTSLAAMRKRSVLQQMRFTNDIERTRIERTFAKGSTDYKYAETQRKKVAAERFWNAMCRSSVLPITVYEIMKWFRSNQCIKQIPEMPLIDDQLGTFENFLLHMYTDADMCFQPGLQMRALMLCMFARTGGSCHNMNMRPAMMVFGEPSTGKSYITKCIRMWCPSAYVQSLAYSTEKSSLTGDDETDRVIVYEEAPDYLVGVDRNGKAVSVPGHVKNMFTDSLINVKYIDLEKDPKTNKTTRVERHTQKRYEVCFLACSNEHLSERKDALIARFITIFLHASTEDESRIVDMMNKPQWANPIGDRKVKCEMWKAFTTLVIIVEKAIEANVIRDVQMDAVSAELQPMLDYVQNTYGMSTEDPKSKEKIVNMARIITVHYAVYAALCSEKGKQYRIDQDTGRPVRLEEDTTLVVKMLLDVEKYLVVSRPICVYTFSLLHTEWLDENFQDTMRALNNMYFTDPRYLPRGIVHYKPSFGGPTPHNFVEAGGRTAYGGRASRDANYVLLQGDGMRSSYKAVAQRIAMNIVHKKVNPDDIERMLKRMSQRVITSHSYCKEFDDRTPNLPDEMLHPNSEVPVLTRIPMVQGGRIDLAAMTNSSSLIPDFGGGGGKNAGPGGAYANSYHRNSSDSSNGGGTDSMGGPGAFWLGISYHLLKNSASAQDIVKDAVQSLAHVNQIENVQRMFLAFPAECEVERPYTNDERMYITTLGKKQKKTFTQHYTLHQIPALFDMQWVDRPRAIRNMQPLVPALSDYMQLYTEDVQADYASRMCPLPTQCSAMIMLDTDPDYSAMLTHHNEIGITHDPDAYHVELSKELRRLRNKNKPCVRYERFVQNYIQLRTEYYAVQSVINRTYETTAQARHAVKYLGESFGTVMVAALQNRTLTDLERDCKVSAADVRDKQVQLANEALAELRRRNPNIERRQDVNAEMHDRQMRPSGSSSSFDNADSNAATGSTSSSKKRKQQVNVYDSDAEGDTGARRNVRKGEDASASNSNRKRKASGNTHAQFEMQRARARFKLSADDGSAMNSNDLNERMSYDRRLRLSNILMALSKGEDGGDDNDDDNGDERSFNESAQEAAHPVPPMPPMTAPTRTAEDIMSPTSLFDRVTQTLASPKKVAKATTVDLTAAEEDAAALDQQRAKRTAEEVAEAQRELHAAFAKRRLQTPLADVQPQRRTFNSAAPKMEILAAASSLSEFSTNASDEAATAAKGVANRASASAAAAVGDSDEDDENSLLPLLPGSAEQVHPFGEDIFF